MAAVTEAQVLDALRTVRDPDLGRDIVALEFIKDLRIDNGAVAFAIELTTPACPVKDLMRAQAEAAVSALAGVTSVAVTMTARVTASRAPVGNKGMIDGVKNVIAVSSGKGGVGKSTVAVNLACALQQTGARVGLLDSDVYGPNVPMMLGLSGRPGEQQVGDRKMMTPMTAYGLQVISIGLMVPEDQPVIWRGPMLHSAVRSFLFDVAWDDLDYLVVDLPPGTGDAQLSLSQQAHLAGALIVTTPQAVSVADVRKAIRMFQTVHVPLLGVVENMAYFTPPDGDQRYEIFGSGGGEKIQAEFDLPLLGQIPIDLAVRSGGDEGKPVVVADPDGPAARALTEVARQVAARISVVNAS